MSDDGAATCVIGEGSHFEGLLSFRAGARVDGALTGRVVGEGTLFVGPGARIAADVDVARLVVSGSVEGDVRARDRVELHAGSRLSGSLRTARIQVDDGARLEAVLSMQGSAADPTGAPPEALEAP